MLLGILQGLFEWLPVSSEGVIVVVNSLVFDHNAEESVLYALWLHLGTVCSVLIVYFKEIKDILVHAVMRPLQPSPLLSFLLTTTILSGTLGLVLLLGLAELSGYLAAVFMGVVGTFMCVTGVIQIASTKDTKRTKSDATWKDSTLAGLAQGLSVLPGISRSGLTVSALIIRGIHRKDALVMSFLMSVPASLGAGLYAILQTRPSIDLPALAGLTAACLTGLVVIKTLVTLSERLNLGAFALILGLTIVSGALWQALV